VTAARAARPLADLLDDDFLPASLRGAPAAVQPYLITRDTFVQRLYTEHAGYWQANGDGIDTFTRVDPHGARARSAGRRRAGRWPFRPRPPRPPPYRAPFRARERMPGSSTRAGVGTSPAARCTSRTRSASS